ncbi:MAG: SRPBCC family protein [Candidatus Dormibacteraeota bacterium]|nr:SRPBCC family protein [Candidatus Dormibacteraeota bacterium]
MNPPSRARALVTGGALAGSAAAAYVLTVRGSLTLDIGVGRSIRALGPLRVSIAAPPETVFDVIAAPYLGRTPRAMKSKLEVLERGNDLVLAAHYTPVLRGLVATTVETVHFERPNRISFRLVRGPVPHVLETFELRPDGDSTAFVYTGTLGTDLWAVGRLWGNRVARSWERAVERSVESIKAEAERRGATGH